MRQERNEKEIGDVDANEERVENRGDEKQAGGFKLVS